MNDETRRSQSSDARVLEADFDTAPAETIDCEPVCFIAAQDPSVRQMVHSVVGELGIRILQFDSVPAMLDATTRQKPDVVFLDFGADASGGASVVDALVVSGVTCPLQLMSDLGPGLVENVRRNGEREGLRMLPILYKPFRHAAIRRLIQNLGLRRDFLSTQQLMLEDVLKENRLEAWYQPKIDLRRRCLVGAEILARVRHPEHGALPPECFLEGATEADLLALTSYMLAAALRDWRDFVDVFPNMKISVNIPVCALIKLPIAAIVKHNRPRDSRWPGIILEITEDEFIPVVSPAQEIAEQLSSLGVGLAVDDCGTGYASLARLKRPPFCELKIDRSFVTGCDTATMAANVCETFIELAHTLGVTAVAEGIETSRELAALVGMKCDMGQGHLFAHPMPKEQFLAQIRQRAEAKRVVQVAASGTDESLSSRAAT